jgi:hypothetical protein
MLRTSSPNPLVRVAILVTLAIAGGSGSPALAGAQSSDTNRVSVGDSVRIRMEGGMIVEAAFEGWAGESMVFDVPGLSDSWSVSVYDMRALEVYTDRTRREGFRHGALLGAAAGLFLGAAIGVALHSSGATDDPDGPADQIVTHGLRGAGIGLVLGALGFGVYRGRNPGSGWIGLQLPTR